VTIQSGRGTHTRPSFNRRYPMLELALLAYLCWLIIYGAVYGDDA
jgi:hypothetical protein